MSPHSCSVCVVIRRCTSLHNKPGGCRSAHLTRKASRLSPRLYASGHGSRGRPSNGSTDVEKERDHLPELSEDDGTDIAQHRIHPPDGNRPYLVTLRRRRAAQPVAVVRLDLDL